MTLHAPSRDAPALPQILADILSQTPTLPGVRSAVELCYRIAYSYLTARARGISLFCRLGTSIDDLACDAVLYVFEREAGRNGFPRVAQQYARERLPIGHDERILLLFRQMISDYLEEEIVRRVIKSYPPVDRILRNLKNAVAATTLLKDVRSGEEHWVAINGPADLENSLPKFPPRFLERMLLKTAGKRSTVPALIPLLAQVMRRPGHLQAGSSPQRACRHHSERLPPGGKA